MIPTSLYREPSQQTRTQPSWSQGRFASSDGGPADGWYAGAVGEPNEAFFPWMAPFRAAGARMRSDSAGRIFLVAVEREVFPPLALGNSILQRMRVTLVPPDCPFEPGDGSLVAPRSPAAPARSVRGEILRDESGKYYEKIGNFVRALGRLEASPEGELVEVEQSSVAPPPRASRKLFPDPGQWRVLRWGEVRGLLSRRIAHPERLGDEHRLPCYIQVVEAGSREPVTELAKAVFGDEGVGRELVGLSPDAAIRLGLQNVLPPKHQTSAQPRERGIVLPGDLLFHLVPANDPTADVAPAFRRKKQEIPEPFASQPLSHTREEVLMEMRTPQSAAERLSVWGRGLFGRRAFDNWQRALWGKSPDDQLWGVAPPAGMLSDRAVQEWATATLDLAGYDASAMLREWEIYWRRKTE